MFKPMKCYSFFTGLIILESLFCSDMSFALKQCTKENCCHRQQSGNGTPYCNHTGNPCKTDKGISSSCLHVKCPCSACGWTAGNLSNGCYNK